ncbi:hypothetical protein, partial [Anabaena sp. CCY 9910]|uniref:hypothetical protein n=1 Tax=Anabaena sp. CCY 9910 TaxID=3103870 RepID=UPI0039E11563
FLLFLFSLLPLLLFFAPDRLTFKTVATIFLVTIFLCISLYLCAFAPTLREAATASMREIKKLVHLPENRCNFLLLPCSVIFV